MIATAGELLKTGTPFTSSAPPFSTVQPMMPVAGVIVPNVAVTPPAGRPMRSPRG